MKRDVLIGLVAGAAALVAVRWAGPAPAQRPVPPGMYQASLDRTKYREMMETLRPVATSAREVRARLETRLDTFRVTDRRIDRVLADLADAAGVDVTVDWGDLRGEVSPEWVVTLDMTGETVGTALRQAVFAVGGSTAVSFMVGADGVRITSAEQAARETVTRVYDVRGLVRGFARNDRSLRVRRIPPATLPIQPRRGTGLFGDGGARIGDSGVGDPAEPGDFATDQREFTDAIVRLIQDRIDPTSWRDAGGTVGGIWELGGVLVVSQTIVNQDDVALILEWLQHVYGEQP